MSYLYIESLGCAKNQVDSEVMIERLTNNGWELTEDVTKADLVIVNTCGFIESAKSESLKAIFELKEQAPKDAKIVVSGCLAQRYADSLFENMSEVDGVFGNRDLGKIGDFVRCLSEKDERLMLCPKYPADKFDEFDKRTRLLNYPGSAFLKISEGCNHRCHYCAIPLIRGDLRSRPMTLILDDARNLVASGIREINVIAQDLAAYGSEDSKNPSFLELLSQLIAIPGDFKIRLLYIHPDAFPEGLLELIASNPKVLPYFDLPMQHANSRVLRAMGRSGDPEKYYQLTQRIRKALPDAVIRTTIMLGFLEEDEDAFDELTKFIKRCRFDWMGSFVYSREEGTPAYDLRTEDQQAEIEKIAAKRQKKLEKIQEKITAERLERFVGREFDVLIEEKFEGEDLAIGRIYSQAPEVDGQTVVMGRNLIPGHVYRCGIRKVAGVDLDAVKIDD